MEYVFLIIEQFLKTNLLCSFLFCESSQESNKDEWVESLSPCILYIF